MHFIEVFREDDRIVSQYSKHTKDKTIFGVRKFGIGKYQCQKCKTIFKSKTYRPRCPKCDHGSCSRIKRGVACD